MTEAIRKFFDVNFSPTDMMGTMDSMNQQSFLINVAEKLTLDSTQGIKIVGSQQGWKNIILPIVKYTVMNQSFLIVSPIIVQHNYYNYAMSVDSVNPLNKRILSTIGLQVKEWAPRCYNGFPEDSVFGSYIKNTNKFSSCLSNPSRFTEFLIHFNKTNLVQPSLMQQPAQDKCVP